MREIKFRGMFKWNGKWEYGGIRFGDMGQAYILPHGATHRVELVNRETIGQYTGLKANQREIYEGDIIENDGEWWQVVFEEGKFICDPICGGNVMLDLSELADSSETWIQGNIYENPELLGEKGERRA